MTEKITKLLDLACEALSLYIRKTTWDLGEALPLAGQAAASVGVTTAIADKPARVRKPKVAAMPTAPEAQPAAGFGGLGQVATPAPAAPATQVPVEEQVESARRCKEVIGLFIRARLNHRPSGVEQATALIKRHLGEPRKSYPVGAQGVLTPMWKLEDFTYAENLKLIPIFEAADAAVKAGAAA